MTQAGWTSSLSRTLSWTVKTGSGGLLSAVFIPARELLAPVRSPFPE